MENSISQTPNSRFNKMGIIQWIAILVFIYSGNDILRNIVSDSFNNFKITDWLWFGSTCLTFIATFGLFFQKKWAVILFTIACMPIFFSFIIGMNDPICKQENEGVLYCISLLVMTAPFVGAIVYLWIKWKKFS